jgi:hypothetical protein
MRPWLVRIGLVLAFEVLVIAVGWIVAAATDDRRWLTIPALFAPAAAVAVILLWPRARVGP